VISEKKVSARVCPCLHDGRFPTLLDVVNHYDGFKKLSLTEQEKSDFVEYLKSL
jgi:hypothetical protein